MTASGDRFWAVEGRTFARGSGPISLGGDPRPPLAVTCWSSGDVGPSLAYGFGEWLSIKG
jgi:hypothetical protein